MSQAPQHPPPAGDRRRFFKRLLQAFAGLWAAGFVAGAVSYLRLPPRLRTPAGQAVQVGPLDAIPPGDGQLVTGPHPPFWVIRVDRTRIVVLPAICTHRHCVLEWYRDENRLFCPCHRGVFDLNGNVLGGPPPRPLEPMSAGVKGGIVYVYI